MVRGLGLLLSTPRTKRLLLPPLALTLVAFGILFSWLFDLLSSLAQDLGPDGQAAPGLAGWFERSGLASFLVGAGQWLLFLAAALLTLWLAFSVVYELIAGPFLDVIHGRIEERWFGPEPAESQLAGGRIAAWSRRGLLELRTLLVSLRAALFVALVLVTTFWIQFVPIIGVPIFFAIAGFTTAVSLLDIPASRRRWSFAQELALVRTHAATFASFGATASAMFLVPVIGPILMIPVASVGSLWLFCRIDKAPTSRHGGA